MKKTFIIAAAVAASIFTGSAAIAGDGQTARNPLLHQASHWYAPVYHFFQPRRHFARHYYGRRYHGRNHRSYRGHGGRHGGRFSHQPRRNHDMGRGRGGGGRGGDGRRGRR